MARNKKNKKNKAITSTNQEQNAKNDAESGHNTPIILGTEAITPTLTASTADETPIIPETSKPENIPTKKTSKEEKEWRKCTHQFCSYKTWVKDVKNCPMHPDIILVKIKK